jgi:hypothetical protein
MRFAAIVLLALTACQQEDTDPYVERVRLEEAQQFAGEPLPSPSVEGAVWAEVEEGTRLLYGIPGSTPMLALACEPLPGDGPNRLIFTRLVKADAKSKALMALVGNFHVARIPVDATFNGRAWVWQGSVDPANGNLEALTGPRDVELTIPGAGSLVLAASPLPGELVDACRTGPSDRDTELPPEGSDQDAIDPREAAPDAS